MRRMDNLLRGITVPIHGWIVVGDLAVVILKNAHIDTAFLIVASMPLLGSRCCGSEAEAWSVFFLLIMEVGTGRISKSDHSSQTLTTIFSPYYSGKYLTEMDGSIRFGECIDDDVNEFLDFRSHQCVLLIDGLLVGMTADAVIHSGISKDAALNIPPFKVDSPCVEIVSSGDAFTDAVVLFVPADSVVFTFALCEVDVVQMTQILDPLGDELPGCGNSFLLHDLCHLDQGEVGEALHAEEIVVKISDLLEICLRGSA